MSCLHGETTLCMHGTCDECTIPPQPDRPEPGPCGACDGRGWTTVATHHPACDGDCLLCPIEDQDECPVCGGTGAVLEGAGTERW